MKKKQCGGVWGERGGLSMDIPFPSDSVPFSLTNCFPLRKIPLAEYSTVVQPGRLGSIKPPPIFFAKSVIFINVWQN